MHSLTCHELQYWPRNQPQTPIINSIDISFTSKNMHLITGAVGSGKSTFLWLLSLLTSPSQGLIKHNDVTVSRHSPYHQDIWRKKLGIVFQDLQLLTQYSVSFNLMLPLAHQDNLEQASQKITEYLQQCHLYEYMQQPVNHLSIGQQQQIAIIRAVLHKPSIVLMDEPTAHQDPCGVDWFMKILQNLHDNNTLVIVTSHDNRLKNHPGFKKYELQHGKLAPL